MHIGILMAITLVVGTGTVFAACQVQSYGLQASISPITLSIPNGRLDSVELTVKNPMALTAGAVYVNNEPVITLSPSQTGVISIPVSAPEWGSGSGRVVEEFDVMITGEGKCWGKTLQVAVSYFPSQEEIAAQQAELQRQALAQQQQQTKSRGTCATAYILGAFLLVGAFISQKKSM